MAAASAAESARLISWRGLLSALVPVLAGSAGAAVYVGREDRAQRAARTLSAIQGVDTPSGADSWWVSRSGSWSEVGGIRPSSFARLSATRVDLRPAAGVGTLSARWGWLGGPRVSLPLRLRVDPSAPSRLVADVAWPGASWAAAAANALVAGLHAWAHRVLGGPPPPDGGVALVVAAAQGDGSGADDWLLLADPSPQRRWAVLLARSGRASTATVAAVKAALRTNGFAVDEQWEASEQPLPFLPSACDVSPDRGGADDVAAAARAAARTRAVWDEVQSTRAAARWRRVFAAATWRDAPGHDER
jgi:hypothetical protein